MSAIFKLLEDLVVECLQFLKVKSGVAGFIVKQCVVFSLLFTVFLILNGTIFLAAAPAVSILICTFLCLGIIQISFFLLD